MAALIQVDVAGEAAGTPGVSREFTYAKVSPTPPLVTLSIPAGGVTQYAWEILSQPTGASATLSSLTVASPTFTPTATIDGTYLIQCTINGGADYGRVGLAFSSQNLVIRKPAPGETTEFSATRGWEAAMEKVIDYVDEGSGSVSGRKRAVIDYVTSTAVPPTEVLGDRYILNDAGAPHANWDGASELDIVQFDGVVWVAETPEEGWVTYADALDADCVYVDDGGGIWEFRPAGTYTLDEGYNQFNAAAAIVTIDDAEGQGDLTFKPTGTVSLVTDISGCTGTADGFIIQDGAQYFRTLHTGAGTIALEASLASADIDVTGTFDVLSTTNFSIDGATASNVTVSGATADLTLGARGTTITLNELGDTALVGYTATSIIGALNEAKTNDTWQATSGEAIAVGDAVCGAVGTADRVNQANADSTAAGRQYCIGFAVTVAGGAAVALEIRSTGLATVTCPAAESWTMGDAIFLDGVAGQVSNVVPVGVGDVVQQVGWAAETENLGTERTMFIALSKVIPVL